MPGGQASNQPPATARAETGSLHSRGWPRPLGRSQALLISNFTLGYDRFPVHAQVPAVLGECRLDADHVLWLSISGCSARHRAEDANQLPGLDRLPLFQAVKNSSSSGASAVGDTLCVWPSRTR